MPTEHVLATQLARRFVELLLGRLDARTASFAATAELMARYFPAEYRVVLPGADPSAAADRQAAGEGAPVQLLFIAEEERGALRMFLRALRRLQCDQPWQATVLSARGASASTPLRAGCGLESASSHRGGRRPGAAR